MSFFKKIIGMNDEEEINEQDYGVVDVINDFKETISYMDNDWELTKLQFNPKDRKIEILQWTNGAGDTTNVMRNFDKSSEIITIDIIKADNTHVPIGEFKTSVNESSKDLLELAIKRASMYMQKTNSVKDVSAEK